MASQLQLTFLDYSLERSPATFTGIDLTAGNLAAQYGLMDALKTAVQGITLGTTVKEKRVALDIDSTATQPASAFAQREMKWLVRYRDTVDPLGDGHLEIPTADLAFLDAANGEFLDLGSAEGTAFVDAFEDFQRSRLGNGVEVINVEFVGRNI